MKKIIATGLAALTLMGGVTTGSAAFAQDDRGRHDYQRGRDHDNSGAAVAAGIAGLAVGAAIGSSGGRGYYRDGYYYGQPNEAYGYYYGRDYDGRRHCRTRTVWDPYAGGYVERTRCW